MAVFFLGHPVPGLASHLAGHQSKYPSLQSRALPHHFTSVRGGQGLPRDLGCLSIFLFLSCSPIPQERLQELQDPQWDTLQSSTFLFSMSSASEFFFLSFHFWI